MWEGAGILRRTADMQRCLTTLAGLRHEVQALTATCGVSPQLLELRNLVEVGELIMGSALQRKESRGLHYCVDFPDTAKESRATVIRSLPRRRSFELTGRAGPVRTLAKSRWAASSDRVAPGSWGCTCLSGVCGQYDAIFSACCLGCAVSWAASSSRRCVTVAARSHCCASGNMLHLGAAKLMVALLCSGASCQAECSRVPFCVSAGAVAMACTSPVLQKNEHESLQPPCDRREKSEQQLATIAS